MIDVANAEMIINAAKALFKLEKEQQELEESLKKKNEEIAQLKREILPDMLLSAGIDSFPLGNGYTLEVRKIFSANIPSEGTIDKEKDDAKRESLLLRRSVALKWLDEHGGSDLVKNVVKLDFDRGAPIDEIVDFAINNNVGFSQSQTVHHMSLANFIREKLANGEDVPLDVFSVYDGSEAKIKKGKNE